MLIFQIPAEMDPPSILEHISPLNIIPKRLYMLKAASQRLFTGPVLHQLRPSVSYSARSFVTLTRMSAAPYAVVSTDSKSPVTEGLENSLRGTRE